jgi:hypothetical protein
MIFSDKPRPPWKRPDPDRLKPKVSERPPVETKPQRPPGYWRERIEFGLIVVGMFFWIQYWVQYQ